MRIEKDKLKICIDNSKQCLISKQQTINMGNKEYLTWPLFFFDNNAKNSDVDVCTSALGVISFSKFDYNSNDNLISLTEKSINTIISIRNEDGSWPSSISLVSKEELFMEGVISDTCYALAALLSVGFLSNNPKINNFTNLKNGALLKNINDRIEYVNDSVEWLLSNRVDHNQGWQYTGISYLEKTNDKDSLPAYTTPTSNAIIILSQIVNIVRELSPSHSMIGKIDTAINYSVRWFCDIQSNNNKDCGFGIKRGERSRIGNTSRVIIALCTTPKSDHSETVEKALHRAVKWMIKKYKPNKLSFADVGEDFEQLIIEKESGVVKNAYRRSIYHETFIEPHLIDSLRIYYNSKLNSKINFVNKSKIYNTIYKALLYLLSLQNHSGTHDGAILSRRTTINEQYTMYSTSNFICTLIDLCNDDILLNKVKYCSLRNKLFIFLSLFFIVGAIVLTLAIDTLNYWLTVPIGIILSIISNILTEKLI